MGTRVMVMAGGTGGHVYPALAVALELRARGCEIFWLGSRDSFESRVVPQHDIPLECIDVKGLRGKGLLTLLLAPLKLNVALMQAAAVIRRRKPSVALGMGGFASGPGGVMSYIFGCPLVIHEQNAVPGLTNRWLAKLAERVLEAFPDSFARKGVQLVGNPVRADIAALPVPAERLAGRTGPVRLLVIGGSLGAQALNETLPAALALLAEEERPQVRHQAGRDKDDATRAAYAQAGVAAGVSAFVEDMAEAYAWADLILCRAGALTLSELTLVGLASVLVPYPHAVDDHQTRNAEYLVQAGAARLLPQSQMDAGTLAAILRELLADRGQLLNMAEAARALGRPNATRDVADACLEVAA